MSNDTTSTPSTYSLFTGAKPGDPDVTAITQTELDAIRARSQSRTEPFSPTGLLLGAPLSSGYNVLDAQGLGPLAGYIQLRAGATGSGLFADRQRLVPALTKHGEVLVDIGEDEVGPCVSMYGLAEGGRNRHLARRVQIHASGGSRLALVRLVFRAIEASTAGRPLPVALVLSDVRCYRDGAQSLSASDQSLAELLQNIAMLNVPALEEAVNLSYEGLTGHSAPDLRGLGIAVIAYTGMHKIPRECLEDTYLHDVATPSARTIIGGALMSYAASILGFQRRTPLSNPVTRAENGRPCLTNTEARILPVKSRYSPVNEMIEVVFDADASGHRGQYYELDEHAAHIRDWTPQQ